MMEVGHETQIKVGMNLDKSHTLIISERERKHEYNNKKNCEIFN